ncbi:hypothetical protein BVRB_6g143690 [Beta vulgaris subsp. vulgaris]|nr:hypothetical protein BVRB_6g143690 [Beta vulgaris subsp. vulgaris]
MPQKSQVQQHKNHKIYFLLTPPLTSPPSPLCAPPPVRRHPRPMLSFDHRGCRIPRYTPAAPPRREPSCVFANSRRLAGVAEARRSFLSSPTRASVVEVVL